MKEYNTWIRNQGCITQAHINIITSGDLFLFPIENLLPGGIKSYDSIDIPRKAAYTVSAWVQSCERFDKIKCCTFFIIRRIIWKPSSSTVELIEFGCIIIRKTSCNREHGPKTRWLVQALLFLEDMEKGRTLLYLYLACFSWTNSEYWHKQASHNHWELLHLAPPFSL